MERVVKATGITSSFNGRYGIQSWRVVGEDIEAGWNTACGIHVDRSIRGENVRTISNGEAGVATRGGRLTSLVSSENGKAGYVSQSIETGLPWEICEND